MAKVDNLLFENLPKKKPEKKQQKKGPVSSISNQKLIFITLVIVGLIAILLLGRVAITKLSVDPTGKCNSFKGEEKANCIENLLALKYIESLNIKKCDKLKTDALRQICITRMNEKISNLQEEALIDALTKKDISICKKSPDRKRCEDAFSLARASVSENIEECDKIGDKSTSLSCKDNILISQALTGKDTCSQLSNQAAKEDCEYTQLVNEVNIVKDPELCHKLNGGAKINDCKDAFYLNHVYAKDDVSFCEKLSNSAGKDSCLTNFYVNKRLSTGDKSFCEKIADEVQKNACLNS